MFLTTRAVVLHQTQYNDRYGIVHCYTRESGRMNFLVPKPVSAGGRRRAPSQWVQMQPLAEVELTSELKPRRELHYIKELRVLNAHIRIGASGIKTSIGIFLSELLYRILTIGEADIAVYEYLCSSFDVLERETDSRAVANFHLCFMFHLLPLLGVEPEVNFLQKESVDYWFDLREGIFLSDCPFHNEALPPEEAEYVKLFSRIRFDNMRLFRLNRIQRARILDILILYYRLHLPPFGSLHSPEILKGIYDSRA